MRWWKYARRRKIFGVNVPFPRRLTFLSGICTATIIGTTTLAFTFEGISIVLVLVLLRGGILIVAPLVDAIVGRKVRWFSWAAMVISLAAVLVILSDAGSYKLSIAAILDVAAYLTAYFFKLQFMTRLAKSDERSNTLSYFVEEQMVASPFLLIALGTMAVIGYGDGMIGFRIGFTTFLATKEAALAMLVGLCYFGLYVCTTFIFLDRRENTFCVPMHCGSSMLSGVTAAYALSFLFKQAPPSMPQLISAALVVVALIFLSPLHHFGLYLGKLGRLFSSLFQRPRRSTTGYHPSQPDHLSSAQITLTGSISVTLKDAAEPTPHNKAPRTFLFVCSGNTCRSPIAAAIGNIEIAERLNIPLDASKPLNVRALSAGVTAKPGAPMTPEAFEALRLVGVAAGIHSATKFTEELAHQVEKIYCMTQAHRNAVIELAPSAAAKTHCLDPDGDVEDPIGKGFAAYVECTQRIRALIRLRFDELNLRTELFG